MRQVAKTWRYPLRRSHSKHRNPEIGRKEHIRLCRIEVSRECAMTIRFPSVPAYWSICCCRSSSTIYAKALTMVSRASCASRNHSGTVTPVSGLSIARTPPYHRERTAGKTSKSSFHGSSFGCVPDETERTASHPSHRTDLERADISGRINIPKLSASPLSAWSIRPFRLQRTPLEDSL